MIEEVSALAAIQSGGRLKAVADFWVRAEKDTENDGLMGKTGPSNCRSNWLGIS